MPFDYDCDWTWYPNKLFAFKMKINYTFKNIILLDYEENNSEIPWNYFNFCSKATETSFSKNSYLTKTSFYSDIFSNTLTWTNLHLAHIWRRYFVKIWYQSTKLLIELWLYEAENHHNSKKKSQCEKNATYALLQTKIGHK